MPLTNAQIKQAIQSSALDNRCFSIYLFLKELITRPDAKGSISPYRVFNTTTNSYVQTVEDLLSGIDDASIISGYDFLDTFSTDRVHTFYAIPTNLTIDFTNPTRSDNKFIERYGYANYIRFSLTYLNEGDTDPLPIKVLDISLTNSLD